MTTTEPIITGAFTLSKADDALTEALSQLILASEKELEAEGGFGEQPFFAVYELRVTQEEDEDPLPPLFVLGMDTLAEPVWMVRGEAAIALIPIKPKFRDQADKRLRPLLDWAGTFAPVAADALLMAAYPSLETEREDESIHLLVDLPLKGVKRPRNLSLDAWLDNLTEAVEERLDLVEADAEVVLFDSSDDDHSSMSGHISVWLDEESDPAALVKDALVTVLSAYTAPETLKDLSVEIEDTCMFSLLGNLFSEDDADSPLSL